MMKVCYCYGDEKFMLPCEHVNDIELQAAIFVLAQLAGVDVKNSMAFILHDFAQKLIQIGIILLLKKVRLYLQKSLHRSNDI